MKTIKIFLASSSELEVDRKAFEGLLFQKSKLWKDERKIFLELKNWEDFIDAMSKTRLQDEYNKAIEECDIFVMLFWTKVGMYTEEEFETAQKQFKKNDKPIIYTYFKDSPSTEFKQASLEVFRNKLKDLGHFPTVYKNTEGLLLHFSMQLDKLYRTETSQASSVEIKRKLSKEEMSVLISKGELLEVFEELNKVFLSKNDRLNTLIDEFINPPNNFNQVYFITRLRLFISTYY